MRIHGSFPLAEQRPLSAFVIVRRVPRCSLLPPGCGKTRQDAFQLETARGAGPSAERRSTNHHYIQPAQCDRVPAECFADYAFAAVAVHRAANGFARRDDPESRLSLCVGSRAHHEITSGHDTFMGKYRFERLAAPEAVAPHAPLPQTGLWRSDREPRASLGAARPDHGPTASRFHSYAKTMGPLATGFGGLISALHGRAAFGQSKKPGITARPLTLCQITLACDLWRVIIVDNFTRKR